MTTNATLVSDIDRIIVPQIAKVGRSLRRLDTVADADTYAELEATLLALRDYLQILIECRRDTLDRTVGFLELGNFGELSPAVRRARKAIADIEERLALAEPPPGPARRGTLGGQAAGSDDDFETGNNVIYIDFARI